ncbi:MAG: hypothetical protein ABH842_02290 [Candidatus Micrarchaeota archaeon]
MKPDISKAALAIEVAMDMLDVANEKFDNCDYVLAFNEARNSMRMSASAILFSDGFIYSDFSTVLSYLHGSYPHLFPLNEWKKIESIDFTQKQGILLNIAQRILNIERHQSKQAIMIAWGFLDSVHKVVGL